MAQSFDGIIVDRILSAVAENSNGDLLYRLTQLSEASIDSSSESKEAKDAQGILIKRTYNSKNVEFKATNAFLDLNVIGETTGSGKKIASSANKIRMPKMVVADVAESIKLDKKPIEGTLTVTALTSTGSLGEKYTLGTAASDTEFAYVEATDTLTFPTNPGTDVAQFLVKYEYDSETGIMVDQRADQFPKTVKLTLSVLVYDPCSTDVLRHAYIVMPSFQVSPDTSFTLTTESTMDFSGVAQVDYCSADKQLYYLVMSDDDVE